MQQQQRLADGSFVLGSGLLQERDYVKNPIQQPLDTTALRLVVPVEGLDTEFTWKVSQILQISFDRNDPIEMAELIYVIRESFNQMFCNFDRNHSVYLRMLYGDPLDPNVPGLPNDMHFRHIARLMPPEIWNQYKTVFLHYALEFYRVVSMYANSPQFMHLDFTFSEQLKCGGGLIFSLSRKNVNYVI